MKKLFLYLLISAGLITGAYSQCPSSVYPAQGCNGEVIFYFDISASASNWDFVYVYSNFGDTLNYNYGFDSVSTTNADTVLLTHTYIANGTYSMVLTVEYNDTTNPMSWITCIDSIHVTLDINSINPPVSTCNGTFTPVQYCMDSLGFVPDYGAVPCGDYGEFYTAFTPLYDTLAHLALPVSYTPWPDSVTIHYGYATAGSPYLYCITTVAVPPVVSYQLDLFADTLSLPTVTLHDTSSVNMFFNYINWGDGGDMVYLNQPSYNHTYLIDGTYTIHADALPADMYNYFWNDSMSMTCLTYDSITVNVSGASNNLSCDLEPVVHYDLTTEVLDFKLTHIGQLVTSPNLDVSWSFSNGMSSTDDFGTISSVNPGPASFTVSYIVYDINHVQTCTASVTNSVNNIYPACNALVYIYEDTVTPGVFWADDQSGGGLPPYSYTWDYGDGTFSNLQYPPTHNYASPGLYMICLTITDSQTPPCSSTYCDTADARAFSSMSQLNVFNPATIGIEEYTQADFKIYPNPASDMLMLKINDLFGDRVTVTVLDITGKVVSIRQLQGTGIYTMDVTQLTTGVYFLTVSDGKNSKTQKLIRK